MERGMLQVRLCGGDGPALADPIVVDGLRQELEDAAEGLRIAQTTLLSLQARRRGLVADAAND